MPDKHFKLFWCIFVIQIYRLLKFYIFTDINKNEEDLKAENGSAASEEQLTTPSTPVLQEPVGGINTEETKGHVAEEN